MDDKKTHATIIDSKDVKVYVSGDTRLVNWEVSEPYEARWPVGANAILSRVQVLELRARSHNRVVELLLPLPDFELLLGEAVAQALYHKDIEVADAMIANARNIVEKAERQKARSLTIVYSSIGCVSIGLLSLLLWRFHAFFEGCLGPFMSVFLIFCCLGGIGAAASVLVAEAPEHLASTREHAIDVVARILIGIIAGGLTGMLHKAGIILGGTSIDTGEGLALLFTTAFVSGFSEKTLSGLIQRMDGVDSSSAKSPRRPDAETGGEAVGSHLRNGRGQPDAGADSMSTEQTSAEGLLEPRPSPESADDSPGQSAGRTASRSDADSTRSG
jgi:hypothetical protein